jgi:hypothetical protein
MPEEWRDDIIVAMMTELLGRLRQVVDSPRELQPEARTYTDRKKWLLGISWRERCQSVTI